MEVFFRLPHGKQKEIKALADQYDTVICNSTHLLYTGRRDVFLMDIKPALLNLFGSLEEAQLHLIWYHDKELPFVPWHMTVWEYFAKKRSKTLSKEERAYCLKQLANCIRGEAFVQPAIDCLTGVEHVIKLAEVITDYRLQALKLLSEVSNEH